MEKKTKFKVEIEIEVEYNTPDYAIGNTPYTTLSFDLNENNGTLSIETEQGKIVNYGKIKFERLEK